MVTASGYIGTGDPFIHVIIGVTNCVLGMGAAIFLMYEYVATFSQDQTYVGPGYWLTLFGAVVIMGAAATEASGGLSERKRRAR
jgi:hypothetical protein